MNRQPTLLELMSKAEQDALVAANTKAFSDLVAGDYLEVWWSNGVHFAGWCVEQTTTPWLNSTVPAWEIEPEWIEQRDTREPVPKWSERPIDRYISSLLEIAEPEKAWRYIRHDEDWSFHPTREELAAWTDEQLAKCEPYDSLGISHFIFRTLPKSRRHEGHAIYQAALRKRWPDIHEWLADKRWTRFPLDKKDIAKIKALVDLQPDERLIALQNLALSPEESWRLFLPNNADDYELWHMLHTEDPNVLVALAERTGRISC